MKTKSQSEEGGSPPKKVKITKIRQPTGTKSHDTQNKLSKTKNYEKAGKPIFKKTDKKPASIKNGKNKFIKNNGNSQNKGNAFPEKVEDWSEFKRKKKELLIKRKQGKPAYDIIVKAKQMGEKLRRKSLKGGEEERNQLINELHNLLKEKGHYAKFVLAHDTARLVQWLLKYSSDFIIKEISIEIISVTIEMLESKYGVFCIKRLLKYGTDEVRSQVINKFYGHAVKLASHAVSAPVFEYACSTWATPIQKQLLIQEFYSDMYKNMKDNNVKHLRDTYRDDASLKAATLSATKANLLRILNKNLLDSSLVQSVLCQYLSECSSDEKSEMITQLAPHIVIISNSKDGSRTAMQCIWHGSNKDRKVIMKTLKQHILELSKHEHGHCTVITLLDSADDTVLLHKILLTEILKNAQDLAVHDWGRKILLWLVAPADSTRFHPVFIKELEEGRALSTSKKSPEIRRKEILSYTIKTLLELISNDPGFWLSNSSLAAEMLTIVKAGTGKDLKNAYEGVVKTLLDIDWKVKEKDVEFSGIEHPGIHMVLKKLAQHDKANLANNEPTFGEVLAKRITNDVLKTWLKCNRGCFLIVLVIENGTPDTQNALKEKLKKNLKLLKSQNSKGASILVKKFSE